MSGELVRIWKVVVVADFKVLVWNFLGENVENHRKSLSR
jgi:hypothetical protein